MKSIFGTIRFVIFLGILVCFAMAGVDYYQMYTGNVPVFNRTYYDSRNKVQVYQGVLYKASRKVLTSTREPLEESSDLKFRFLIFDFDIPSTWKEDKDSLKIKMEKSEACSFNSDLYYADLETKIYTYCINQINVNNKSLLDTLKKDKDSKEEIFSKFAYQGLLTDGITEVNQVRDFNDLVVYHCHNGLSDDLYFVPNDVGMPQDLCVYKDDDFKFIFEIDDQSKNMVVDENTPATPEIIYQDEEYIYQFDSPKSSYIFITTPEVRGKAASSTPLMSVLNQNLLTIDELIEKGLDVEKVEKNNEVSE